MAEKKAKSRNPKKKKQETINEDKLLIYTIAGLVLVFAVFLLGINYLNSRKAEVPEVQVLEYNGFTFEKLGKVWKTRIIYSEWWSDREGTYDILFHYSPIEVEQIPSLKNTKNESTARNLFLDAKEVYITIDPDTPSEMVLAEVEIDKVFSQIYQIEAYPALLREDARAPDVPVKTCDDIGATTRIIELRLGNKTEIYNNHGCLVIEGETSSDVVRAADRFAYELLGIIN